MQELHGAQRLVAIAHLPPFSWRRLRGRLLIDVDIDSALTKRQYSHGQFRQGEEGMPGEFMTRIEKR